MERHPEHQDSNNPLLTQLFSFESHFSWTFLQGSAFKERLSSLASDCDETLSRFPEDVLILNFKAYLYFIEEDYQKAQDLYKRVLVAYPNNIIANVGLAYISLKKSCTREAQTRLNSIGQSAEDITWQTNYEKAYALRRMGKAFYTEAISAYETVQATCSEKKILSYALIYQVNLLNHLERYTESQEKLNTLQSQLSKKDSLQAEVHILTAKTHQRTKDKKSLQLIRSKIKEALKIAPENYWILRQAGDLLRKQKSHEKAMDHLKKSIALHPTTEAFHHLGIIYLRGPNQFKSTDKAEFCLRQALSLKASNFYARMELIELLVRQNQVDAVLELVQTAPPSQAKASPMLLFLWARCLLAKQEYDSCNEKLHQAIQIHVSDNGQEKKYRNRAFDWLDYHYKAKNNLDQRLVIREQFNESNQFILLYKELHELSQTVHPSIMLIQLKICAHLGASATALNILSRLSTSQFSLLIQYYVESLHGIFNLAFGSSVMLSRLFSKPSLRSHFLQFSRRQPSLLFRNSALLRSEARKSAEQSLEPELEAALHQHDVQRVSQFPSVVSMKYSAGQVHKNVVVDFHGVHNEFLRQELIQREQLNAKASANFNSVFAKITFVVSDRQHAAKGSHHRCAVTVNLPEFLGNYLHVKNIYGFDNDPNEAFLDAIKASSPSEDHAKIESLYRNNLAGFRVKFHHSERALYGYLSRPDVLQYLVAEVGRTLRVKAGLKFYAVVIDFRSTNLMCDACKKSAAVVFHPASQWANSLVVEIEKQGHKVLTKSDGIAVSVRVSAAKVPQLRSDARFGFSEGDVAIELNEPKKAFRSVLYEHYNPNNELKTPVLFGNHKPENYKRYFNSASRAPSHSSSL